jgi:hypothetical protein
MAYDAAASGAFLLTLQEWGEWEYNVRATFEHKEIARRANVKNILSQLEVLKSAKGRSQSWIEEAMHNAIRLDKLFLTGAKNIVEAHRKISATN